MSHKINQSIQYHSGVWAGWLAKQLEMNFLAGWCDWLAN